MRYLWDVDISSNVSMRPGICAILNRRDAFRALMRKTAGIPEKLGLVAATIISFMLDSNEFESVAQLDTIFDRAREAHSCTSSFLSCVVTLSAEFQTSSTNY